MVVLTPAITGVGRLILNVEYVSYANFTSLTFYLILIDNYPIGQVRFEDEGNYSRIDYSIARQFRGRKLAKKLLYKAIEEYQKYRKKTIFGEVLPGNYSSAKTFESLGFNMKIKKGIKIFTKNLGIVKKKSA